MARILSADDPANILEVSLSVRRGGVVVLPTDPVYGLSASIFQPDAVSRVFEIKQRPAEARVPLLLATAADLPFVVEAVPDAAWSLIEHFWPGPLTLVLPAARPVPRRLLSGGSTVAVRVPAAASCLQVLQQVGEPLIGTSANLSGSPPALTAAEADHQLPGVDAVLSDDAAVRAGTASTVVEVGEGIVTVHRTGAVGIDQLRELMGARVHLRHPRRVNGPLTSRRGGR